MSSLTASAGIMVDELDQDFFPGTPGIFSVDASYVQTFTVGLTGQLTTIELSLANVGEDTQLEIVTTSGGTPTTNVLGAADVPEQPSNTAMDLTVDLTPISLSVTAGDVLGFRFTEFLGAKASYSDFSQPDYTGGRLFSPPTELDLFFRTYVNTSAGGSSVPEPSSFALLGLCVAGLALQRYRSRKPSAAGR